MAALFSYSPDFFSKYSILEATKQIFVQMNDSSIDLYQKVQIDSYHHSDDYLAWISN